MSAKSPIEAGKQSPATEVPAAEGHSREVPARLGAWVPDPYGSRKALPTGATLCDGRLSVLRRIGEGGMGVVYEVFDSNRKARLALKTGSRLDATAVYQLKNEFRALADVRHPNLVRLHELFAEGDSWFFTMDLVNGAPFDRWVRPGYLGPGDGDSDRGSGVLDESRLRSALPQLVAAVSAIHAAGKVHRDLKPSNVLITPEGQLVVLDFGLAVAQERGGVGRTITDESLSGTPAYMAPEQAAGKAATQASDFYAIGSMLFEALTGELPFAGWAGEVLAAKQHDDAPRARTLRASAPADLDALCAALLARDPRSRPGAVELRELLGAGAFDAASNARTSRDAVAAAALIGRDGELLALREAYEATLSGTPVALFVLGESGIGKSALIETFLGELRSEGRAVVLWGRCYERENVPYKGFDALIDELSRYLRKLSREEAAALLPRQVCALARLFPVLDRVSVIAEAPKREIPDPQELQRLGFAALRELLWAMRDRRPLVLYIDDLQWIDRDSTVLLEYLLGQTDAMPVLSIGSYRVEGGEHNLLLQAVRNGARENRTPDVRELRVGPLSADAARRLAQRHLGGQAESAALAERLSREAGGSPFFVGQLAHFAQRHGTARLMNLSLGEALADHVAQLPSSARSLLELLALAGQPLPASVAVEASSAKDGHASLDLLRAERLVRGSTSDDGLHRVECYHDRVREWVSATLSATRRVELHAELARTLEMREDAAPELLATCYEGAGDLNRAAHAAELGGDRAVSALAFERASGLYAKALELGSIDDSAKRSLRIKCGDALVGAGRGPDAARAYRQAAVGAERGLALDLKRKAAHQLMTAGHVDEGRALLGEVLASVGLRVPSSPRGGQIRALFSQARLRLRGLALRERHDTLPSEENARALDVLWTVLQGLAGNDPFMLVGMVARYLRLSLDAGSELHAARGLSYQAFLVSAGGIGTEARATALAARAVSLAERNDAREPFAFTLTAHGAVFVHLGRFALARKRLAEALELLRTRCRSVAFELAVTHVYDQIAAYHLGELRELAVSASTLADEAVRRGDLWEATMIATAYAVPSWLAADTPDEVRARLETVKRRRGVQSTYRRPDAALLLGEQRLLRYVGDGAGAFSLVSEQWPSLERARLLRAHVGRAMHLYDRGSSAVAAMKQGGPDKDRARAVARSSERVLRSTHLTHAPGWAALLAAGLALSDGQDDRAHLLLRSAIAILDGSEIAIYAAAARRRLGERLGGQEGSDLVARGDAAMRAQGVQNLDAMTEMLCPGCRPR